MRKYVRSMGERIILMIRMIKIQETEKAQKEEEEARKAQEEKKAKEAMEAQEARQVQKPDEKLIEKKEYYAKLAEEAWNRIRARDEEERKAQEEAECRRHIGLGITINTNASPSLESTGGQISLTTRVCVSSVRNHAWEL